jgi:hypothetical protein
MELEQKNSKTNQLKIQNQWRKIMRLAKVCATTVCAMAVGVVY